MKKYLIALLMFCLLMTGCQTNVSEKSNEPALFREDKNEVSNEYAEVSIEPLTLDMLVDSEEDLNDEEKTVLTIIIDKINKLEEIYTDAEEQLDELYYELEEALTKLGYDLAFEDEDQTTSDDKDYSSWTLKSFLGFEYSKLTTEQLELAEAKLTLINQAEETYTEETAEDVAATYTDMYDLLKTFGLKVPVTNFEDFLEAHADKFSQIQKNELLELDEQYNELKVSEPESDELYDIDEKIAAILTEAGFDSNEVFGQLESGSVEYAKYKYDGVSVTYVGDKSKERTEDIRKYELMIQKAMKIISPEMKQYLEYFVIDSDGIDNTLAYVLQENEELTRWRMALDIKDAFDEEGNYIDKYNETIVHEFAHILTLNAGQMQKKSNGTYETEEGILAKNSLLNQFYQKFWTDISDEYKASVDSNNPDSVYDFYDKNADQFVSDYAATNPEEDIAETFRVFVYTEKPEGDSIKDQKINWMYDNEQLNDLRTMIRENLAL
jgi:hypothetical protein